MAYLAGTITDDSKIIILNNAGTNVLTKQLYPEDEYTKLLLHFDSAPIVDSSPRNQSLTLNGGVTITAPETQAMFGGYSGLFNGSTQFISIPDSEDWNFGSGDFTVDFWINFSASISSVQAIVGQNGASSRGWSIYKPSDSNSLHFTYKITGAGAYNDIAFSTSLTTGIWYHVAAVRNGVNLDMYLNGSRIGTTHNIGSNIINNANSVLYIGENVEDRGYYTRGYIDELRISKGIARWTSNFTPPIAPYTSSGPVPYTQTLNDIDRYGYYINDITVLSGTVLSIHPTTGETTGYIQTSFISDISSDYTKLLLHFNESPLVDTMGKALTLDGGIARSATQSKFGGYAGYFDGVNDRISSANSNDWNLGSMWTIDFWVRFSTLPSSGADISFVSTNEYGTNDGWQTYYRGAQGLGLWRGNSPTTRVSWTPSLNTWYHIAYVQEATGNPKVYVDGSFLGTFDNSAGDMNNNGNGIVVGCTNVSTQLADLFNGYIDELRISKGIVRWKHNFIPPTLAYTI